MNRNRVRANKRIKAQKKQPTKVSKKITKVGQFLREAGGFAGGLVGFPNTGRGIGAMISRATGQGKYRFRRRAARPNAGPPAFRGNPTTQVTRISHREYLGDILSTTAFQDLTYRIQPASPQTFPWLSQIATSFEQYKFDSCCFYLNSTCGNAISSTNNALGVWGGVTIYDPAHAPVSSKSEAENYAGCASVVPSTSLVCEVECKKGNDVLDRYYVDVDNDISGQNLKWYDRGKFNLFTQGMQQASVNLGELWVTYTIDFYLPRVKPTAENAVADHYSINGTQVTATWPLGSATTYTPTSGSGLGTTISGNTVKTINFPAGSAAITYLVLYMYNNPTNTTTNANVLFGTYSSNFSAAAILRNSASSGVDCPISSTNATSQYMSVFVFDKLDTNAGTITVSGTSGLPTSVAGNTLDVFILPMPANISLLRRGVKEAGKEVASFVSDQIKNLKSYFEDLILNGNLKPMPLAGLDFDAEIIASK